MSIKWLLRYIGTKAEWKRRIGGGIYAGIYGLPEHFANHCVSLILGKDE